MRFSHRVERVDSLVDPCIQNCLIRKAAQHPLHGIKQFIGYSLVQFFLLQPFLTNHLQYFDRQPGASSQQTAEKVISYTTPQK